MSCGHEETIELFGKNEERKRRIQYFELCGLCKECWKKEIREKNKKERLIFNVSILPYVNDEDGAILACIWFSGGSYSCKNEIKELGYEWDCCEADLLLNIIKGEQKCWRKIIKLESLERESDLAEKIGAKKVISDDIWSKMNYQMALVAQKKWHEKKKRIKNLDKPKCPIIVHGKRWNFKVYGRDDFYSIYADGEKIHITNEEAEELKNYVKKKEEYDKKVCEINKC